MGRRLINNKAELHWDLVNVEEHIKMLKESGYKITKIIKNKQFEITTIYFRR